MKIVINNSKTINIPEASLIVKNNRLFNIMTNEYEGLDGDKITFCAMDVNGKKYWVSGKVDGYTCNRRIKLQGVADLFACAIGTEKTITHRSLITECDCEFINDEDLVTVDEEWAAVVG